MNKEITIVVRRRYVTDYGEDQKEEKVFDHFFYRENKKAGSM